MRFVCSCFEIYFISFHLFSRLAVCIHNIMIKGTAQHTGKNEMNFAKKKKIKQTQAKFTKRKKNKNPLLV